MADEQYTGLEYPDKGKVTICTAVDCIWNDNTRCTALGGVVINFHKDHADCNTYTENAHIPGQ